MNYSLGTHFFAFWISDIRKKILQQLKTFFYLLQFFNNKTKTVMAIFHFLWAVELILFFLPQLRRIFCRADHMDHFNNKNSILNYFKILPKNCKKKPHHFSYFKGCNSNKELSYNFTWTEIFVGLIIMIRIISIIEISFYLLPFSRYSIKSASSLCSINRHGSKVFT